MPEPGELRRVPLLIAVALIVLAVALELGAAAFLDAGGEAASVTENLMRSEAFQKLDGADVSPPPPDSRAGRTLAAATAAAEQEEPPGLGIPYLGLVDGILAWSLGLMALALLVPDRVQGKLQGIVSLILSLLLLLASIALILTALALLLLMVSLAFAVPFGTIAYLAVWGDFPKGTAAAILGLIMTFKVTACILLPIAHQRFLQMKGLILLMLTSLLATLIVTFLHAIVPGPLVSITDALAAIVVGILGAIWAIVYLISSLISVIQSLMTT